MQNFENLDVFEILITHKLLKCPKDPFLRSALIFNLYHEYSVSEVSNLSYEIDQTNLSWVL